MRPKKLLQTFDKRYQVIEHDGGYILYDKEGKSNRANALYLGYFFISTDGNKFSFNGDYYDTVDTLIEAMNAYNSTLPFDAEIYNPMYRKHCKIEMALHDYLKSLGLTWDFRKRKYDLTDAYGQPICSVSYDVKEDTTEGNIVRYIRDGQWTEAPFTDLDSAIGAVNEILALYCISINATTMNVLNGLTNARSSLILDKTFSVKTLSVYTEDAKQRTIEHLEKELKMLKGEA